MGLIISLLFRRGPTAIGWFIVTVVVYAVKRRSLWALSHVGDEVDKVKPSFAEGDSTTAVPVKTFVAWALAPFLHGNPGIVCRSMGFTMAPMRVLATIPTRANQAFAGLCPSAAKKVTPDRGFFPARTQTQPHWEPTVIFGATKHRQFPKSASS